MGITTLAGIADAPQVGPAPNLRVPVLGGPLDESRDRDLRLGEFARRDQRQAEERGGVAKATATEGGDFPIDRLQSRPGCLRCGPRKVRIAFDAPTADGARKGQRLIHRGP